MSQAYVNQLTINCLVNKDMINKHVNKKQLKKEEKEEIKFYRKRTYNLFKEIINGTLPEDLLPDVKYAYDNFVNASIHYFKTIDNNDIIQKEYEGLDNHVKDDIKYVLDASSSNIIEADKLLMRSVKINLPETLDKHVTKTTVQKKEADIFLPKQKEINLLDPKLQFKGLQNKVKGEK
jgi:hypothetical protein